MKKVRGSQIGEMWIEGHLMMITTLIIQLKRRINPLLLRRRVSMMAHQVVIDNLIYEVKINYI